MRVLCKENYKNGAIINFEMKQDKEYEITPAQLQQILADNPHAVIPMPKEEFLRAQGMAPDPESEDPLVAAFGENIAERLRAAGYTEIGHVEALIEDGELENVPGIGPSRAARIYNYFVSEDR